MFKQYKNLIDNSIHNEDSCNKEFHTKKTKLTLEMKQILLNEIEFIDSKQLLKDYSPIQHTNKITELNNKFSNLILENQTELEEIKINLNKDLLNIMKITQPIPKNYPTELYKIINSCITKSKGSNSYVCRVYFTLIPIKEFDCKPGDPIRIEFIKFSGCNRFNDKSDGLTIKTERFAQGISGIKMPQFINTGSIIHSNSFYDFNHFGHDSDEQNWWLNWIKQNRPM